MIVLHLANADEGVVVWGEAGRDDVDEKTGATRARFDAGAELIAALQTVLAEREFTLEDRIGWLPTVRNQAQASSALVDPLADDSRAGSLRPWTVSTVLLSASDVVDLLAEVSTTPLLAPGIVAGNDVAWWRRLFDVAAGIVVRQQVIPALRQAANGWDATWQPVVSGPVGEQITSLEKTMPLAVRSIGTKRDSPPSIDRQQTVSRALMSMVDALIRSAMTQQPIFGRASAHDRWLKALASRNGRMALDDAAASTLAAEIAEWQRPLTITTRLPFRLLFRLEEPDTDDGPWSVGYFLQALSDPSLRVSTSSIWSGKARGRAAVALRHLLGRASLDEAREYLLLSLGVASSLSSGVAASLEAPTPSSFDLDATGAFRLLSEEAAGLELAGFHVVLPAWWTRSGSKRRVQVKGKVRSPKFKSAHALDLNAIVKVDWSIAIGGETLTRAEIAALAASKEPLVRLRGQWVQVTAGEIEAALEYWRSKGTETTLREVIRMRLGATPADEVEVAETSADGWVSDFLERLGQEKKLVAEPPPETLEGTLRPYQERGYSWLSFHSDWGLGACLADDMGLGKTIQALALVERNRPLRRKPVLLICPTSVTGNWQREAERFTPGLTVLLHHGAGRARGEKFVDQAASAGLVVSTYALLQRDLATLQKIEWDGVVLDEAQNIKNAQTRQAQAARALRARYRLALTGTPVENNIGDLWSISEFLNPGLLGTQAEFRRRFFLPIQTMQDPEAIAGLKRLTSPFILRRLKSDRSIIADLPEKVEMKVYCTLTREQASLYKAVADEALKEIEKAEGVKRKGIVLATLTKLKQVCNHPRNLLGDRSLIPGRSGKLARLEEMMSEALSVGDRALIFTQFTEMAEMIRVDLQESLGQEVLYLHGGTPKAARDRMVERFQSKDGTARIFLLSLKAGGTGLNLTRANHVFHFDRWWNPAVENQATDRAYRIGQTRNVQVHKFVCAGTVEERIDELIESKKALAGSVIGTGEGWITELSTTQLREVFALRQEIVMQ